MTASTVGSAFTALGASSTTATFASAVYTSAVTGALVGAAMAAISGDDITSGALKGAAVGGVTGAVSASMNNQTTTQPATGDAGLAPVQTGDVTTETPATQVPKTETQMQPSQTTPQAATAQPQVSEEQGGLLSKATKWIEKNPKQAELVGKTLGSAAKAMLESRTREKELEAAMERAKLQNPRIKLSGVKTKSVIPNIAGFAEKPEWSLDNQGLFKIGQ
jgi:hypothetical protein